MTLVTDTTEFGVLADIFFIALFGLIITFVVKFANVLLFWSKSGPLYSKPWSVVTWVAGTIFFGLIFMAGMLKVSELYMVFIYMAGLLYLVMVILLFTEVIFIFAESVSRDRFGVDAQGSDSKKYFSRYKKSL